MACLIPFIQKSIQKCLIFGIGCYRFLISGFFGHCCRFGPSCSEYAVEAIKKHGSLFGIVLALFRILQCHPWHPGGEHPVPQQIKLFAKCDRWYQVVKSRWRV